MFVGCTALTYCPKALLASRVARPSESDVDGEPDAPEASAVEPTDAELEYRSPFQTWYERASVRQAPRRTVSADDAGLLFFSPDLVPVARHHLVEALPSSVFNEILIQHLYRYLDFTAKLEYLVVNRTVLGLAHGTVGVRLPEPMRFDALKMYCDEAYHALFSVDLRRQVEDHTGVAPRLPDEPFFLRRLREILDGLDPGQRPLAELLFVVISETLISASLAEMPDNGDVVPAVRETIRDHATDEGRHHAYFAVFLRHLWGQLTSAERRLAGRLVPRLMDAFLRPDLDALHTELTGYGLSAEQAEQISADVYPPQVLNAHALATSRLTRRYFAELGAFDDPGANTELHAYGFIPQPGTLLPAQQIRR